jgi:23S rRNA (uracil1939-C5)-methyltransferase
MSTQHEKIIPSLFIQKLIYGGNGLARDENGKTVFVSMALPGEEVSAKIVREKKDYAEAIATKILLPAPERRAPLCPVFGECGGCQLQHLSDSGQALHKMEIVREFMQQIKQKEPVTINPIIVSSTPLHYRLRVQLTIQNGQIGFYRTKSHRVVPVNSCPITIDPLNKVIAFMATKGIGLLTDAYYGTLPEDYTVELQGTIAGEVLIVLIAPTGAKFSIEKMTAFADAVSVTGMILYHKKKQICIGKDYLVYDVMGRKMRVGDRAFVQGHGEMHDLLVKGVLAFANSNQESRWLELHAGAGMFTLFLSEIAASIVAVEENPQAVADANFNLQEASCKGAEVICSTVDNALPRFTPHAFTHLFMDPPRAGITPQTIKEIARLSPLKILYLSCHPATLVRDIRGLMAVGYHVTRVQPFDLFPQTGHLEILVALENSVK